MTKTKAKTTNKDLPAKQGKGPVATAGMFENPNDGFEEASRDSYALPFLVILQQNSPQLNEDEGAYIKGAKAGHFLNTSTNELFKDAITVIPCYFQQRYVEWVSRENGGGYKGDYTSEQIDISALERDDSGKFILENGNNLVDTRYHFCLLITKTGPKPVVIAMSSTQIKASRNWMTMMRDVRAKNPDTKEMQSLPMFANLWKLAPVSQKNEKGTWKGYGVEFERTLKLPGEKDLFLVAKELHATVRKGQAHAEQPATFSSEDNLF